MKDGTIGHNKVLTGNGGGVFVEEFGAFNMLGGGVIYNQALAGDGGGIFTQQWQQALDLTPGLGVYDNLIISKEGAFMGNVAKEWFFPPTILSETNNQLPNIGWNPEGSSSITQNGTYLYLLNNYDINFRAYSTTLTISKEVLGSFGNPNKEFEFTIYFQDKHGNPLPKDREFYYVGEVVKGSTREAPLDGKLVLNENGAATFRLAHHQAIHIKGIPLEGYVRVVETRYDDYLTSFIDSENGSIVVHNNDTSSLAIINERTLTFLNEREIAPPTGINIKSNSGVLQVTILTLIALSGMLVAIAKSRYIT
jgi:hypothetical protein